MAKISCSTLSVSNEIELYHVGPSLDKGPFPVIFYFALSGEDSLCLDPYNQPVQFLSEDPIRIVSITLPAHEANLPPTEALKVWAEDLSKGKDMITDTVEKASAALDFLIDRNLVLPNKIAAMGLSRGGFISSHFAAADDRIRFILQFAPLTNLELARDFENVKTLPIVQNLHVQNLVHQINDRHIRLYIGNYDERVDTASCFSFFQALVQSAIKKNKRPPPIEMSIFPSIGQSGHGTPPYIFQEGADWLASLLLAHK